MSIKINGMGRLVLSAPVPEAVLATASPCITPAMDNLNNILWLEPSPDPELYDEDSLQAFLRALFPYVEKGELFCSIRFTWNHNVQWAYRFQDKHLVREFYRGSKPQHETIC